MTDENKTIIGNIKTIETENDFGMKSTESPFAVSFYFDDYYDEKTTIQFIKSVEKLIRSSREYKTYIELLRTNIFALNHDSIMSNITTADVDLEFHHTPFTLYDIIESVMIFHVSRKERFTSFSISKEVMDLHYKHKVGLTPLTKTTHELAHSGNLFISQKQIFGDYHSFMEEYQEGIPSNLVQKVTLMEDMSRNNVPSDFKGLIV